MVDDDDDGDADDIDDDDDARSRATMIARERAAEARTTPRLHRSPASC